MAYTSRPFNYTGTLPNQVQNDLGLANDNFDILGQAFIGNDPSSQPIKRAVYIGSTPPSDAVADTLWFDTSVNPPILKVYDGTNWRLVSSPDADTVDSFHASQTPAPNVIVPLDANGILDLSATYVKSNVYTFRRIDLTNATNDYELQVGEEAYVSFSNVTSVPLHIATQSGTYYEMNIIPSNNVGTSGASSNPVYLNPNNTTYTNAFTYVEIWANNSSSGGGGASTYSAFRIGWGYTNARVYLTNFTNHKAVLGMDRITGLSTSPSINCYVSQWNNTTTNWTSLGTVTFPQSSSGYILVRRLL
jgi:hypothetical protein